LRQTLSFWSTRKTRAVTQNANPVKKLKRQEEPPW